MDETDLSDSILARKANVEMPEAGGIYERITKRVILALEAGTVPWVKPWHTTDAGPNNIVTGHAYTGINVLMLWMTAASRGYTTERWVTANWLFNEGKRRGMRLRRLPGHEDGARTGQRISQVIYWGRRNKSRDEDVGENDAAADGFRGVFARSYGVFNLDQIEGVPDDWIEEPADGNIGTRMLAAQEFAANCTTAIDVGGNHACYSPSRDRIRMPAYERFLEKSGQLAETHYWGTLFHELTHWTGHSSRLARIGIITAPDEKTRTMYAFEELVAEMGSAFMSARYGFDAIQAHASYVGTWIQALQRDNRMIVRAASAAQRAVEFMDTLQPKEPA